MDTLCAARQYNKTTYMENETINVLVLLLERSHTTSFFQTKKPTKHTPVNHGFCAFSFG